MLSRLIRQSLAALLVCAALPAAAAVTIKEVRVWRAPDHTRVVFDLSAATDHQLFNLESPRRVVVDIDAATMPANMTLPDFAKSPVRQMRHAPRAGGKLRVVFDIEGDIKPRSFALGKVDDKYDRLVIDFFDEQAARESSVKKVADVSGRRDIVIAIDAGHGGEDPGALGPRREREKTVVLEIAERLRAKFDAAQGYRAVMIRKGDYYVGLTKRRDLARAAQADMFVSIHADAFTERSARGASVYALSKRSASSATARFLAASENRADRVGGVSLADKPDDVKSIIADLSMAHSLEASSKVGGNIIGELSRHTKMHSNTLGLAPFAVLKSLDIPSLLVETGFISNPHEARLLNTASHQQKLAGAIFNGIDQYFRTEPPDDTLLAAIKRGDVVAGSDGSQHVVSRGDTLSEIANRYRISVSALKSHNKLAGNTIRVGQKLRIPDA